MTNSENTSPHCRTCTVKGPPEDVPVSYSSLRQYLEDADAQILLLQDSLAKALSVRASIRDAILNSPERVSILDIPPEILPRIFTFLIDPAYNTPRRGIPRLLRVCKQWNQIIQEYPPLWSTINCGSRDIQFHPQRLDEHATEHALSRSKDELLDVTCDIHAASLLQLFTSSNVSGRIQRLSLDFALATDLGVETGAITHLPALTHFKLTMVGRNERVMHVIPRLTNKLKVIDLSNSGSLTHVGLFFDDFQGDGLALDTIWPLLRISPLARLTSVILRGFRHTYKASPDSALGSCLPPLCYTQFTHLRSLVDDTHYTHLYNFGTGKFLALPPFVRQELKHLECACPYLLESFDCTSLESIVLANRLIRNIDYKGNQKGLSDSISYLSFLKAWSPLSLRKLVLDLSEIWDYERGRHDTPFAFMDEIVELEVRVENKDLHAACAKSRAAFLTALGTVEAPQLRTLRLVFNGSSMSPPAKSGASVGKALARVVQARWERTALKRVEIFYALPESEEEHGDLVRHWERLRGDELYELVHELEEEGLEIDLRLTTSRRVVDERSESQRSTQ
ncbi:hypothetical protein CYLTODRAFT_421329 [Cylindrobasidium torrendii FP15055 ss-10]|uniref:F-box domain-containing protein n=1 Tax=Cylindrobasidium torrendii FP15055 ss-10 TaxID=1314674 RepID=A0A0D7BGK1_9AGAR|nr:hypothetical protein CYLTODRAFT_421329 [Cylindrobasidium torrendii FP15055 ss-10]